MINHLRCEKCNILYLDVWGHNTKKCNTCTRHELERMVRKPQKPKDLMQHIEIATRSNLDDFIVIREGE